MFEDQRLERTDFAVVHNIPSIGAGPIIALIRKLEDSESSDKFKVFSKCLCSLSVRVTRWS